MQCPNCLFKNPEDIKFCGECGTRLERHCPHCNSQNPPNFKFCGQCGRNFIDSAKSLSRSLSLEEKLDKIQRYLPKGLTEKILAQKDRIEGERKQVTVMFCDMQGFTSLVEEQGAEAAYTLMDQVYELLINKVHDYEGTVNEMTGDGIMALFGAPIALEDAPQRAIRSAHAIHREMTRFHDKLKKEGKPIAPLKMRIGIHSGPVVVGTLGNNLRVEFKAVGDTVNLASRMEGLAEPGATYVSGATFKLTEGFFRFEALGERQVKGKAAPVAVYRVIAPSTHKTRFDVNAERGLTTFVGRERELALLMDGLARVKEGIGQSFSITGEAGIGKSRFLYEFRKAVSNEDITFLEGKCLSYGKGIPYHAISDILKGNFGVEEGDADADIRKKVSLGLEILNAGQKTILPYLLELLAVKDSGIDQINISPEGRKDRIVQAVKQIILKGAQIRPLVIAIEDLHWADKSTEDVLLWLLETAPVARVLIIFTYRPEYEPTWKGRSYHNQITLNRLSNRESLYMLPHLFNTAAIDTPLQQLVLSKTEGVPFFIEEFVKSLQELDAVEKEAGKVSFKGDPKAVTMPSTIQDMIMSRADRLSDATKAVLQVGSVIEREFRYVLISAVTEFSEQELLDHFAALKDAEFLYERGVYPLSSYIFRHALTREVIYASLITGKRRDLHRRIGTAIEEIHKEDISEHYEILSEHFYQSEDYAKAADYAKKAARKAEKSASLPDAITHMKKRIRCLENLPDSDENDKARVDARTFLGIYLVQSNHWADAREVVEPVAGLAQDYGYRKRFGQILSVKGSYYLFVEENFPKAFDAFQEALGIAKDENDFVSLIVTGMWLGVLHSFECEFEKAVNAFQPGIDITVAVKSLWGIAAQKAQQAFFGYLYPGNLSVYTDLTTEALKIAEKSGDPFSMGVSNTAYGWACLYKGHMQDAVEYLQRGRDLCQRVAFVGWAGVALDGLAEVYFRMGQYDKTRQCILSKVQAFTKARIHPSEIRRSDLCLARIGVMLGEKDVDLTRLRTIAEKEKQKLWKGRGCARMGEILLNLDRQYFPEAALWIQKAIDADTGNGLKVSLPSYHERYADLFNRQGDKVNAKKQMERALAISSACGADGLVERFEKQLNALS